MAVTTVLQGPKGPHGIMCASINRNALYIFVFGLFVAMSAEAGTPRQSLRARLEAMVRGSPITESSTTNRSDPEWIAKPEPESFSKMSPADRFRLIIQAEAEAEGGDATVQVEPAKVLHPIRNPKLGRPASRHSGMAKVAVGVLPPAALFSQVLFGSRIKSAVLEEISGPGALPFAGGSYPLSFDATDTSSAWMSGISKQLTSRADRVKTALTSNTAVGIYATAAAIAAVYFFTKAQSKRNKLRGIGLLAPTTAKWDLQQCLLIIDIHGAQEAGAILGKYVPKSARVKVNVNTQHATLTYSRIPAFTHSPLKSLMRKVETVQEHFNLPVDYCFVSAAGASRKQILEGTPRSFIQEYMEKSTFGGERVAALVIHTERSPGLQVVQQSVGPPAPPPVNLLDAIHLKHQTAGENMVELEESRTVSGKDAALGSLNDLIAGSDICGGPFLCVDSVSISTKENLCTVHVAVKDMRPLSVFADVALQTLSIVVDGDGKGASDEGAAQVSTTEYHIALPPHCVLSDVSRAAYTVAPFSVNVEPCFGGSTGSDKSPLGGPTEEAGGEIVTVVPTIGTADKNSAIEGERYSIVSDKPEMESDTLRPTVSSSGQEGVNSDDAKIKPNSNSSTADYQHVRIQFRPLPKSEVTVSLSLLPGKQLPR